MFKYKIIVIISGLIIILTTLLIVWFSQTSSGSQPDISDDPVTPSQSFEQLSTEEVNQVKQQEVEQYESNASMKEYQSDHGFSFKHTGLAVSSVPNVAGDLVIFDKGPLSFQIFITPFDEPGPITPERIEQDLPGLQMNDVQYATLGEVKAIFFHSNASGLDTYEAWMVTRGRMYQVLTYRGMEDFLHQVLGTWQWK